MPIFIPLIGMVCSFLLMSRKDRKTYKFKKYIYFLISFILLMSGEIAVRYSGISWSHTFLYYLIPILLVPIFYIFLIREIKYENLA